MNTHTHPQTIRGFLINRCQSRLLVRALNPLFMAYNFGYGLASMFSGRDCFRTRHTHVLLICTCSIWKFTYYIIHSTCIQARGNMNRHRHFPLAQTHTQTHRSREFMRILWHTLAHSHELPLRRETTSVHTRATNCARNAHLKCLLLYARRLRWLDLL